ncbi:hypothetical protein PG994_000581 [Apiospora phragmitis]|uniref:Uncharacterized protein n=1 Tax=Apiospora phragmitis TaxID=2905665 RepID=A0ABR1X6M7_9PEZI
MEVEMTSTEELEVADDISKLSVAVSVWLDVILPELMRGDSEDSVDSAEMAVLPEFSSELLEL